MSYSRITWANGEGGGTPINATNLNIMDVGISDIHGAEGWVKTGANVVFGAYANGDPRWLANIGLENGQAGPTGVQIGSNKGRARQFRLPKALDVNSINFLGGSTATGKYKVGLYRKSDGALLFDSGAINTTISVWTAIAVTPGTVLLSALADYYVAILTTDAASALPGMYGPPHIGGTPDFYTKSGSPLVSEPTMPVVMEFTCPTPGSFPATLPAANSVVSWTGNIGVPAFFLVGTAS